jgi:hypothetical protein
MRIIKRIKTAKQQTDSEFRAQDKWSREVIRELTRLGYDPDPAVRTPDDDDGDSAVGRVYFTGVGARQLTVVVRTEKDTARILRVTVGRESMTARQAALWLHKRAAREKRYL